MKGFKPGFALALAAVVAVFAAAPPSRAHAQAAPTAAQRLAAARAAAARRAAMTSATSPARSQVAAAAPASVGVSPGVDPNLARGMAETGSLQAVSQSLQQIHLTTCAGRVMQIATFLFEGQDARFITQPMGPDSDRWPTELMIESADPTAAGRTRAATIVVNPDCSGMYQQTIYWPRPCADVKATTFAQLQPAPIQLLPQSVVLDGEKGALQVFLMAAGGGCVSIKKEMFH